MIRFNQKEQIIALTPQWKGEQKRAVQESTGECLYD